MAKGLEALLGATVDVQSEVYVPRLKTHFTVKALTDEEIASTRARATTSKSGAVDTNLLNRLVIAAACVDPDFRDPSLTAHYKASDAEDCVKKALLPGEIARVVKAVMETSGFVDDAEIIEDAKN